MINKSKEKKSFKKKAVKTVSKLVSKKKEKSKSIPTFQMSERTERIAQKALQNLDKSIVVEDIESFLDKL